MFSKEVGQTLIELIVVITVGILVVGALTFAVLFSLRNAKFSQNQNQATKLTQEGLEKVRSIRNRDEEGKVIYTYDPGPPSLSTSKFSELWNIYMSSECVTEICYFTFNSSGQLTGGSDTSFEPLGSFSRQVQFKDESTTYNKEKTITVVVKWTDSTGDHQSKITTFLGKI